MENGKWMRKKWKMDEKKMENGKWKMENGKRKTEKAGNGDACF